MKRLDAIKWIGATVIVGVALNLTGCSGGSSSSNGGGDPVNGTIPMSEEEQALISVFSGGAGGIVDMAQGSLGSLDDMTYLEGMESDDTTTTNILSLAAPRLEGGEYLDCSNLEDVEGEGAIYMEEGKWATVDFPDTFTNNTGVSVDDSILMRADCVLYDENSNPAFHYEGSMDMVVRDDIDGLLLGARVGGFNGYEIDDAPDLSGYFKTTFPSQGGGLEYRAEIYSCSGCVDGDLANFTGDLYRDNTTRMFSSMIMEMTEGDYPMHLEIHIGENPQNPYIVQTTDLLTYTEVEMNGRLAFLDHETGCGFDVTHNTVESLVVAGYDDHDLDDQEIVSGKVDVTINDTGRIFTVEFVGGEATIYDSAGNPVTPTGEIGCGV